MGEEAATYVTHLVRTQAIAPRTRAFFFEKPEALRFSAGQFGVWVALEGPEDTEGQQHRFTIASAPHEDFLVFASRMRDSEYKNLMARMPIGGEIRLIAPQGKFTLGAAPSRPVVCLTGGIGITPFRSILLDAIHRSDPREIWAFVSNDHPRNAPFLADLVDVAKRSPQIHVVPTFTKEDVPGAERGWIDLKMIKQHVGALDRHTFMIAGPPGMVHGLRDLLRDAHIPEERILTEDFEGYE
ncbi:MAG: FAD-dependent oxidoreductase [Thermoplasmatota archaeon]